MSVVDFRRFAPPERLRCFAPRNLMQLLAPHAAWLQSCGFPIPSEESPPDHAALSELLSRPAPDTPEELIDAIALIDEVSDGPNIDLLIQEAEAFGVVLPIDEGATAADIAVQVYFQNPGLLHRCHAKLALGRLRTYETFRAGSYPAADPEAPRVDRLGEMVAILNGCMGRRWKNPETRIVCAESGAWLCLLICHGHLPRGGGDGCRLTGGRGLRDAVAYHRGTGELRVSGRTREVRSAYRRAFGRTFFGSEDHFISMRTGYTLDPLRRDGKASLACLDVGGIERITLKRLVLDWGGQQNEVETREALDLFALYEEKGEAIARQAVLRSATFEVVFSDSRCPRHVTIQPPNMVNLLRDGDGPLVEEWLRKRNFAVGERAGNGAVRREDVLGRS